MGRSAGGPALGHPMIGRVSPTTGERQRANTRTASAPDGPDGKLAAAEPIRTLIVDDHALFRRGLEMVLESEADIEAGR